MVNPIGKKLWFLAGELNVPAVRSGECKSVDQCGFYFTDGSMVADLYNSESDALSALEAILEAALRDVRARRGKDELE